MAPAPLTATALRKLCRVRNATLQAALAVLVEAGRVFKDRADYANRALIPDSASRDP